MDLQVKLTEDNVCPFQNSTSIEIGEQIVFVEFNVDEDVVKKLKRCFYLTGLVIVQVKINGTHIHFDKVLDEIG